MTETEASENSTSPVELCERLYQYDFTKNLTFLSGWNKVRSVIPADRFEESLLKAQVYFYSREVEKVSLDQYRKWLADNNKDIRNLEFFQSAILPKQNIGNSHNKDSSGESPVNGNITQHSEELTEDMKNGKHPENFMELVEMIQKGVQLPDTEDLNIQPLNENPTPSEQQRPLKPWEKT